MGRAAGGGLSWMLVATVVSKLATSITQFLLGWWLLPEHFARFAIATTVAGLLMLAKDGGLPSLLTRGGPEQYPRLSGPSFWMCLAYNTGAALVMAAAAWPISTLVYQDSKLAPMLWVMAISLPLGTSASILQSKLRLDLRFRDYALLITLSGLLRQVLTIVLAKMHFEEMSLAAPVVLTAIFDSIAAWYVCSDKPWRRPAVLAMWGKLFSQTKWLINGCVAAFTTEWGPYLALGLLLTRDKTGYYFFAYQITAQIGMLLQYNLNVVLLPVLARLNDQPERQRDAFLRLLRGLTLVGSFLSLSVAVIISPLEHLLWHGKWAPAVAAVIIFGIFYPWRVSVALTSAVLMAQGRFKRFAGTAWFEGITLTVVVAIAAWYTRELVPVAICSGLAILITRLLVTLHVCRMFGIPGLSTINAMFTGWIISLVAAAPAFALDQFFNWTFYVKDRLPASLSPVVREGVVDAVRCAAAGSIFCLAFLILAGVFLRTDVLEAVKLVPVRVRRPVSRLLRLGSTAPISSG